jgi:hypothetical protein
MVTTAIWLNNTSLQITLHVNFVYEALHSNPSGCEPATQLKSDVSQTFQHLLTTNCKKNTFSVTTITYIFFW